MLRNRNSFFQEASMSSASIMPNMPYQMNYNMPVNAGSASQSYYSGPVPNQQQNYNSLDDIDNRIAKLERQINRLDARISKLENSSKLESVDISSNMYMV